MSTPRASAFRLVADIGGTHARFALVKPDSHRLLHYRELVTAEYPSLAPAVEAYLADTDLPHPTEAAVAIANPVTGDRIKMTNPSWAFSTRATQKRLGLKRLLILNDFAALALSLPLLPKKQMRQIGPGRPLRNMPRALIGPGTGLGMAGLIPRADSSGWIALPSEGGHVTASATNELESSVIAWLRKRYHHVSAERLVSGPGLVNIYHGLCHVHGKLPQNFTAAEISGEAKRSRGAPHCRAAVEMFCGILGSLAGDLALTLGARGGVWVGGGIVPAMGSMFDRSNFRTRFSDKGRMSALLESIPTFVVESPHAAMLGDLQALDQDLH
jgi:glucokinase